MSSMKFPISAAPDGNPATTAATGRSRSTSASAPTDRKFDNAWVAAHAGAHSDFGGERFALARDLDAYLAGHTVYSECSAPSARERETERVMLALRTTRGVAADTLPEAARRILRNCEAHGLAHLSGGFYALTPRGFLVSNAILVDLLETMEL